MYARLSNVNFNSPFPLSSPFPLFFSVALSIHSRTVRVLLISQIACLFVD